MAFHSDSSAIKNYIQNTYPDLIEPIEALQWANWKSGNELPNGKKVISLSFLVLAMYLSCSDGELSIREVEFLRDINDLFSEDNQNASSHSLQYEYLKMIINSPDNFKLQVPYAVTYLEMYDKWKGTNYADQARTMFFRFANAFVKADNKITVQEQDALLNFKNTLYPNGAVPTTEEISTSSPKQIQDNKTNFSRSIEELLKELNSLTGLENVKNDVNQLVNFLKVQQMRQAKGMSNVPISRHLVFYGNPGTGKTTVARLLAEIYKTLNVISKGHLVETDRSGLVAGYVGQTALKVQELVNKALGGILFIDEAYTLTGEGQDYGREAIDTLLKLMEDNRNDLIIIVAGYTEKMGKFLLSNPGFKSRFNKYLSFDDYSPFELTSIFELFCSNSGFKLTKEAHDKILGIFKFLFDKRDETFGNARLARNVFEQSVNNQANRIVSSVDISEETLSTIHATDIPDEVEIHSYS